MRAQKIPKVKGARKGALPEYADADLEKGMFQSPDPVGGPTKIFKPNAAEIMQRHVTRSIFPLPKRKKVK